MYGTFYWQKMVAHPKTLFIFLLIIIPFILFAIHDKIDIVQSLSKFRNRVSNPNSDQSIDLATQLLRKEVVSKFSHNKRIIKNTDRFSDTPLLALFTTWPDSVNTGVKNNTCYNWGSLRPLVQPILFTNSKTAAAECEKNGWTIRPLTYTEAGGAPVLKLMFLDVMHMTNASLYAYANGDILFGDDLVQTLLSILVTFRNIQHPLLIVGTRTNVNNVSFSEASSFRKLHEASNTRGKRFISMSEDYFITNKAFLWSDIPGVVVGRVAYDNWLVLNSINRSHIVIDVTHTVLAVHQSIKNNNFERKSRPYPQYNTELLHLYYKSIRYVAGTTTCAPFVTMRSVTDDVFVLKRMRLPSNCQNPYS